MKKYFVLAAVVTMFAACTNEDVPSQVDALTGMPIQVKTNIVKMVDSRVVGNDTESDVTLFLLDIQPQSQAEGETDYFVQMKKENSEWKSFSIGESQALTECDMVWSNSNPVTVSALVKNSTCTKESYRQDGTSIPVKVNQSTIANFKESDILYMAPKTVTPSENNTSIEVNVAHLMSKLVVSIESENEVSGVKVSGTYKQRYFKPTATVESERWGRLEVLNDITACKDETTNNYEVILVPQDVESGKFSVSFTVGEKNYKWTSTNSITLQSGKIHNLALKVVDDDAPGSNLQAISMSIEVADWPAEKVTLGGNTNDAVVVE